MSKYSENALTQMQSQKDTYSSLDQSLIEAGNIGKTKSYNTDAIYKVDDTLEKNICKINVNMDELQDKDYTDDENDTSILNINIDAIPNNENSCINLLEDEMSRCRLIKSTNTSNIENIIGKPIVDITSSEQSNGRFLVKIHIKGFETCEKSTKEPRVVPPKPNQLQIKESKFLKYNSRADVSKDNNYNKPFSISIKNHSNLPDEFGNQKITS